MNQDTSKMSSEELRALAASLMKQAEEQSLKEFESTMNFGYSEYRVESSLKLNSTRTTFR